VFITSTASSKLKFPLRDMVKRAWESVGLHEIEDPNSGSPLGFGSVIKEILNYLSTLRVVL
jgi:hypothetical protein